MNGYMIFWGAIIFFSLLSFIIMSFIMLIKGIPELKEMFKQLENSKMDRTKKSP